MDIYIHYFPSIGKFVRTDIDPDRVFDNGETVGIWEDGNKPSGSPRISVTVKNYFNGGYGGSVVIDQVTKSSPCEIIWSLGNHTISAPSPQDGSWFFDHWSDGGAQSHTVTVGLGDFAKIYTAYYWHDLRPSGAGRTALACYPNPLNPSGSIQYYTRGPGQVRISVFDALGREIAVLVDEFQEPGSHHTVFDGSDFASGLYYCRLRGPDGTQLLRLVLMK